MEDHEGLTESSEKTEYLPWFADFADNLCTYYMSMGVTYDEYWYGDSSRFHFYEETYQLKEKHENYIAWLHGRYIYEAVGALSPILHAFAKEGTQARPYPEEPYPLSDDDKKSQEERKRRRHFEQMKATLERKMTAINSRFTKGGENDG